MNKDELIKRIHILYDTRISDLPDVLTELVKDLGKYEEWTT